MNTRVLIVLALIIAGIAGWFFQQQGDVTPPVNIETTDVDYEATDIKAVQTNRIQAGSAAISQQTGELSLSGGFTLVSEGNKSTPDIEPIKVTGSTLKGNTKSGKVYSDAPVKIEQGMNRFEASSMTANLETGEYEFGQVAVAFSPSERQDKALF